MYQTSELLTPILPSTSPIPQMILRLPSEDAGEVPLAETLGKVVLHSWALGCDNCRYGIKNYWNVQTNIKMPTYLDKLAAYHADELVLCECQAGQAVRRWIDRQDEKIRMERLELEEFQRTVAERRQMKLFDSIGVPFQLRELKFADYVRLCGNDNGKKAAIGAIKFHYANGHVNDKRGIMLYGPSDRGKTGALSPLFLHYLGQEHRGLWVQYSDLLSHLKNFDDGQLDQRMNEVKNTPLLFLDDLGDPMAEKVTDYTRQVIFQILDHRCNRRLMTFVTSNLNPGELAALFHERTVKRLGNLCEMIEVSGPPLGVLKQTPLGG